MRMGILVLRRKTERKSVTPFWEERGLCLSQELPELRRCRANVAQSRIMVAEFPQNPGSSALPSSCVRLESSGRNGEPSPCTQKEGGLLHPRSLGCSPILGTLCRQLCSHLSPAGSSCIPALYRPSPKSLGQGGQVELQTEQTGDRERDFCEGPFSLKCS